VFIVLSWAAVQMDRSVYGCGRLFEVLPVPLHHGTAAGVVHEIEPCLGAALQAFRDRSTVGQDVSFADSTRISLSGGRDSVGPAFVLRQPQTKKKRFPCAVVWTLRRRNGDRHCGRIPSHPLRLSTVPSQFRSWPGTAASGPLFVLRAATVCGPVVPETSSLVECRYARRSTPVLTAGPQWND